MRNLQEVLWSLARYVKTAKTLSQSITLLLMVCYYICEYTRDNRRRQYVGICDGYSADSKDIYVAFWTYNLIKTLKKFPQQISRPFDKVVCSEHHIYVLAVGGAGILLSLYFRKSCLRPSNEIELRHHLENGGNRFGANIRLRREWNRNINVNMLVTY